MKIIFFSTILILITALVNADEIKQKTTEELMKEFIQLVEREKEADKRIAEEKAKTEAVMRLGKTVDKLVKKLGVDD